MATKRKATTLIVAGVTAVALLLGGTFAWTSISQQAKNEAIVDINPGGRLHDDFNGTNKDVYVENFGDTTTGVPIFARIRLDQYFEVGQDAGINKDGTDRKVNQVLGTDINDVDTWVTYIPGDLTDTANVQANGNWSWNLGKTEDEGLPYYMPTFNKDKDSLAADINGTYEGLTEGDIVHYDDYVQYGTAEQAESDDKIVASKTDTEVYDWDDEDADEEEAPDITYDETTPRDSADVYHKEGQEHTATQLSTGATVMTMQAWIDAGSVPGPYWVYDTDGWAYWAQAIEPTMTTGLLLDSIQMTKVPDDNYYYGINVVAQFATAGDIQAFNSGLTDDETWTAEAEELFAKITNTETVAIYGFDRIAVGSTVAFDATRMVAGTAAANQPTFTWTATDADGAAIEGVSIDNGKLSVADTVADGTEVTITAMIGDGTATVDEETTVVKTTKVITVSVYPELESGLTHNGSELGATISTEGDVVTVTTGAFTYTPGDTYQIKLNRNIDLEKSLADDYTTTEKYSIPVVMTDDTLTLTLDSAFTGNFDEYITLDGIQTPVIRLKLYTDSGEICVIMPQKMVESSKYVTNLRYTSSDDVWDGSAVALEEGTELQDGDGFIGFDGLIAGGNAFGIRIYFYDENGNMLNDYSVTSGRLKVTATEDREVTLRMTRNLGYVAKDGDVCDNRFYYRDTKVTIKGISTTVEETTTAE